jgi:cytochrome c peroxidase
MKRYAFCAWLAAMGLLPVGAALAHGQGAAGQPASAEHRPAADEQVLAPGYGPLQFEPPEPGSYSLPALGAAADGEVLAVDGSATTLHRALGEGVAMLSFVYASCNDVNGCPLATAVLHRVRHRLLSEPQLARRVRLVTLSFDPARDTPEVMRRYGASLAGDGIDWRFLTTASERELRPILRAYGQTLVEDVDAAGNPVGTISHILRVFLIDSQRRIRNIYTVSFLHADTLVSDLKTILMEEASQAADLRPDRGAGLAPPGRRGPGDYRGGYESSGYTTRSVAVAARRGRPADLAARVSVAPLGLPPVPVPADNPITAEKVALGRRLFYDRRLSANGTFSCAMCHIPEQGFTSNELATAVGIEGRSVRRNSPTIYNVGYQARLFHDGRETRLEHQVWGPLLARNEMGNASIGSVVERVRRLDDYASRFERAFPDRGLAMETIGMALASYERTLVSGTSPFDRWHYGGDEAAVSDAAKRGFELFRGKAGCVACHPVGPDHALFSDGGFHNTGVGYAAAMSRPPPRRRIQVAPGQYLTVDSEVVAQVSEPAPGDLGLYEITQDPADRWKYRTPSLRNAELTAPYMHDGSLTTLRDVVAFYDAGGVKNEVLDPLIRPLGLRPAEVDALVAFLVSLTGADVDSLVSDAFAAPIGDARPEQPPGS